MAKRLRKDWGSKTDLDLDEESEEAESFIEDVISSGGSSSEGEDPKKFAQRGGAAPTGPGWVYVLKESGTDFYKVGFASLPARRVADLKAGNPRQLKLKKGGVIPVVNKKEAEQWAHAKLAKFAVSQGGGTEWFKVPKASKEEFFAVIEEMEARHGDPTANIG